MIKMVQKANKDFPLLVEKQVFQRWLLLLIQQLLHDLEEITGQNRQRIIIFVQELAESINERVVFLWNILFFLSLLLRELGTSKFCLAGLIGLISLFLVIIFNVLSRIFQLYFVIVIRLCILAVFTALRWNIFNTFFEPDRCNRRLFLFLLLVIDIQVLVQRVDHLLNLVLLGVFFLFLKQTKKKILWLIRNKWR